MTLMHYIAGFPRTTGRPNPAEDRVPADPRASLRRLIELLQAIVPERPAVTIALEQCIEAIVVDELRHRIQERLLHLSPEDLATVEALTARLANELPTSPDDEAA
jgi:hypothetical protein